MISLPQRVVQFDILHLTSSNLQINKRYTRRFCSVGRDVEFICVFLVLWRRLSHLNFFGSVKVDTQNNMRFFSGRTTKRGGGGRG